MVSIRTCGGTGVPRTAALPLPTRRGDGAQPPNDWESVFGGSAWGRTRELDGSPGDWYLHFFDPGQPDLDWSNPRSTPNSTRCCASGSTAGSPASGSMSPTGWSSRPDLPDLEILGCPILASASSAQPGHPGWDQDGVHDVYRRWRSGGRLLHVRPGSPSPRHGCRHGTACPLLRPDDSTAPLTSISCARRGGQHCFVRASMRPSTRRRRQRRTDMGLRTTTSSALSPGSARLSPTTAVVVRSSWT